MSDLKACPFCGRIPNIEDCGEHRWFIRCKCGIAQDKLFFQKCDAVRAWNKRKELRVKDTNVPITDTISRQAAIDALACLDDYEEQEIETLRKLPSAQPERKTGKWKPFDLTWGRSIYFCTACNDATEIPTFDGKPMYKFCPNCGAEMKGEQG